MHFFHSQFPDVIMTSEQELINAYEEEQRAVVFTALSEYLSHSVYTDITLIIQNQPLKAHKVVLDSSSKVFRDLFRHNPSKENNVIIYN